MTDELALLRAADPVAGADHPLRDQPLDDRATTELLALTSGEPVRPRRARWGLVAAGAAAVLGIAVVVGTSLVDGGAAPAYAATPPLLQLEQPVGDAADAAARLQHIAAQAAGSSEQRVSERGSSWDSWSLSSQVSGAQVTSAVVPERGELTWAADLSGRLTVTAGEPYFPTREHRRAWQQHAPVSEGDTVREVTFGAGEYRTAYEGEPPGDVAAMEAYLRGSHPVAERGTADLVVAITDLSREWRLGPAQRSAVLQVLAQAPDVRDLGGTRDRLGRQGEAFAVESDFSGLPTRYVLVVDPSTGRLLSSEQWLTTDAGRLDVPVPSVIGYTAFRD